MNRKRQGFTLIELLVIISLIIILLAVAIPVYSGFRTRARNKAALYYATINRAAMSHFSSELHDHPTSGQDEYFFPIGTTDVILDTLGGCAIHGYEVGPPERLSHGCADPRPPEAQVHGRNIGINIIVCDNNMNPCPIIPIPGGPPVRHGFEIRTEHPNGNRNYCATEVAVCDANGLQAANPASCQHDPNALPPC